MATHGATGVERLVRAALLPVCAASGIVVVSGFFFPWIVGSVVTGRGWLVVALLFFGSGLAYLALLPLDALAGDEDARPGAPYLLRVRHVSPRDWASGFLARQDPITFGVPVLVLAAFFAARLLAPGATTAAVAVVDGVLFDDFAPLFLGAMFLAVLYALFLLVGPWGAIKLGGPDAEPTYTYPTYFAMVFTAGIAAGVVFWGPAESLFHYGSPPPGTGVAPRSDAAVVVALSYALFHWGVSAWSAYLVVGLPIAYFTYRHGAPLRVSTILTPFLGVEGLDGYAAKLVDVLAVFATIGGVATSVAIVGRQFLAGVAFQWGVSFGGVGALLFVAGLVVIYSISAESGVQRGIRRIAGVNLLLFALLSMLLVAVGPRGFVLDAGVDAVGRYATEFVAMSLSPGGDWAADWTVWNWSWWFSWAPFAGLFLAALSKGRRVRTVVFTGVVATSAASVCWHLLLGGTALSLQHSGRVDALAAVAAGGGSEAVAGFPVFAALPLSRLLMFLFLALIVVFIVTSADTSTLVVSILATERGHAPTTGSIVFWGVLQGLVAVAVLLVGGGESLQTAAVATGGPFAVLSLVSLYGLTRTFRRHERGHPTVLDRAAVVLAATPLGRFVPSDDGDHRER
ncbi:BCCT family transporter [Haloplanus halophilus]|uniref:BCCT family transporter n=1 Tax=Haloplanus halophilus TaxID=2949993 RepID=UPI00203ABDD3|nr:BCCT family transporter [Haloplanus sp. GDY1]